MNIELDKIKLIKHDREEGKTKVLNTVLNLNVSEKREIVEHRIPGMEGGVLQDMGRSPVKIDFEGMVYGKDSTDVLKELRSKFKAGKPMPFTSDLTAVTDITQVIIEDLEIFDVSGSPQNYKYRIKLREYIPPKKKDDPPPSQDADAKQSVDQKADNAKKDVDSGDSDTQTEEQQAEDKQAEDQEDTSDTQTEEQQAEDHPTSGVDDQVPSSGDTDDAPTSSTQQPSDTGSQPSGGEDAPTSSTQDPSTGGGGEEAPSSSTGEQQRDSTKDTRPSTGDTQHVRGGAAAVGSGGQTDDEDEEDHPTQR